MKLKRGGAYVDASPFIKRGGVYAAVSAFVKTQSGYVSAGQLAQVIEPFAIGSLSFAGASIDTISMENGHTSAMSDIQSQFDAVGITGVTAHLDAQASRSMSALRLAMPTIIASVLTRQAPRVVVFANILGNDVSGAGGAYGRPDLAPAAWWNQRIADLDYCVQLCRDNGIRPIVTNTSWRNYGGDMSCRTDEAKGSRWVDETYLHPYIRENLPDCWDFASERPMIDCYRGSWHIGDWGYEDHVHPNELGKIFWRRFVGSRIALMATGVIPAPIVQQTWPFAPVSSARAPVRIAFTNLTSTGIPAAINVFRRTGAAPGTFGPLKYVGGSESPLWVHISHNTGSFPARGNLGDTSDDITNDSVLKYSVTTNNKICVAVGGLEPLEAVRVRFTASTAYSEPAGDRVVQVSVPYDEPQTSEIDLDPTNTVLTFETVADGDGIVFVSVTRPSGSVNAAICGIEIAGRTV